ncbi:alpha/beta hydrolase [Roseomonas populi]|uniref:Alpha/beta fold hydrolase n=1 Tax=Roseomonas populi TaxID=3121582 RepID=A0ABT1XDU5_9PROT|nr:alpha/beta hydrolase [Roseomonas pecuniae]MCR0985307.1 alpha/beta fold hydrolase [Roseomonas pecuniae]
MLRIQLLGDLAIARDEEPLQLPPSRKTRALLAYLVLNVRPHRRERLCELFWDIPDDPRGALRWSLSKLRPLVDDAGRARLLADRQVVSLDTSDVRIDLRDVRDALNPENDPVPVEDLKQAAESFGGEFLAGLDLPDCQGFQAWCVAMREDVRALQRACLASLIQRLSAEPEPALHYSRRLLELDRHDQGSWIVLVRLLLSAGRRSEAEERLDAGIRLLDAAGLPAGMLRNCRRDLRTPSPPQAQAGRGKGGEPAPHKPDPADRRQEIRFCAAADGTRIAYAEAGNGPPLLRPANWMTHLEYDWHSPVWRHWIRELSRDHRLVRYDERGNGLSDWEVGDLSFEACMSDLSAVVAAAGLERFPMLGISQGCAFAVAYAVQNPERVSHLILYGGYARGWAMRGTPAEAERRTALGTLIRHGWGEDNPAFRQAFTTLFVPDASPEQMQWFNELQRITVSPDNAERLHHLFGQVDVQALLPKVRVPTLVLHARGDGVVPFAEGRLIATTIPKARFVPLDSRNHILLEDEPAWEHFVGEVRAFLAGDAVSPLSRQFGEDRSV